MAIKYSGIHVDIYEAERRLDTWLWLGLQRDKISIPPETFGSKDLREILKGYIGEGKLGDLINNVSRARLLPLDYFKWIDSDERKIKWLSSYVEETLPEKIINRPARLFGRDYIIACIDLQVTGLEVKCALVDGMRFQWNEHLKIDKMFKWFNDEHEFSKCECAWEWVLEKAPVIAYGRERICSYETLLTFFDECKWSIADKKLAAVAIRNRWYQRNYRSEKEAEGKQLNVRLSNKAVADLDKLAKKYGVKRPQIIEALIRSEAMDGKYLPERMREISFD